MEKILRKKTSLRIVRILVNKNKSPSEYRYLEKITFHLLKFEPEENKYTLEVISHPTFEIYHMKTHLDHWGDRVLLSNNKQARFPKDSLKGMIYTFNLGKARYNALQII